MSAEKASSSGGFFSKVSSWMTSFAGIVTAVATITTSTSAVLGVLFQHQTAQLQQARATVSQQARQIQVLRGAPAATPSATPVANSAPASLTNVAHFLSDLTATVDNSGLNTEQQVINAQPYAKSVTFYCSGGSGSQPDLAYDVAGSTTFTAMAGIPDNMQDATDVVATITFSNESGQQVGKPIQVSLGHPVKVNLGIGGVTQLGFTCNGRDARTSQATSSFEVTLGDAGIS